MPFPMSDVVIVIPCYNEEARLAVDAYKAFLLENTMNLLFVDDGSSDGTLMVLERLQSNFPAQVQVLHLDKNMGKAEAVRRGIMQVCEGKGTNIVGFMDADLSTPFEEIGYFLGGFANKKIEFVFGSRIARIGARIKRYNYRHYFGRVVATLVSVYLKIPIYDSQCGAKFFHTDFAVHVFRQPFVSRWLFDVEIFRRIALLGIDVENCALELPLRTWIEKGGSKIALKDYLKLPFEFYKIIHYYNSRRIKAYIYQAKAGAPQLRIIVQKEIEHAAQIKGNALNEDD